MRPHRLGPLLLALLATLLAACGLVPPVEEDPFVPVLAASVTIEGDRTVFLPGEPIIARARVEGPEGKLPQGYSIQFIVNSSWLDDKTYGAETLDDGKRIAFTFRAEGEYFVRALVQSNGTWKGDDYSYSQMLDGPVVRVLPGAPDQLRSLGPNPLRLRVGETRPIAALPMGNGTTGLFSPPFSVEWTPPGDTLRFANGAITGLAEGTADIQGRIAGTNSSASLSLAVTVEPGTPEPFGVGTSEAGTAWVEVLNGALLRPSTHAVTLRRDGSPVVLIPSAIGKQTYLALAEWTGSGWGHTLLGDAADLPIRAQAVVDELDNLHAVWFSRANLRIDIADRPGPPGAAWQVRSIPTPGLVDVAPVNTRAQGWDKAADFAVHPRPGGGIWLAALVRGWRNNPEASGCEESLRFFDVTPDEIRETSIWNVAYPAGAANTCPPYTRLARFAIGPAADGSPSLFLLGDPTPELGESLSTTAATPETDNPVESRVITAITGLDRRPARVEPSVLTGVATGTIVDHAWAATPDATATATLIRTGITGVHSFVLRGTPVDGTIATEFTQVGYQLLPLADEVLLTIPGSHRVAFRVGPDGAERITIPELPDTFDVGGIATDGQHLTLAWTTRPESLRYLPEGTPLAVQVDRRETLTGRPATPERGIRLVREGGASTAVDGPFFDGTTWIILADDGFWTATDLDEWTWQPATLTGETATTALRGPPFLANGAIHAVFQDQEPASGATTSFSLRRLDGPGWTVVASGTTSGVIRDTHFDGQRLWAIAAASDWQPPDYELWSLDRLDGSRTFEIRGGKPVGDDDHVVGVGYYSHTAQTPLAVALEPAPGGVYAFASLRPCYSRCSASVVADVRKFDDTTGQLANRVSVVQTHPVYASSWRARDGQRFVGLSNEISVGVNVVHRVDLDVTTRTATHTRTELAWPYDANPDLALLDDGRLVFAIRAGLDPIPDVHPYFVVDTDGTTSEPRIVNPDGGNRQRILGFERDNEGTIWALVGDNRSGDGAPIGPGDFWLYPLEIDPP